MKIAGLFFVVFGSLLILMLLGSSEGGAIFGSLLGGLGYSVAVNDGDKS